MGALKDEGDGAPICPWCGVTALPGRAAGARAAFVCDNPDCGGFGEAVSCTR